MNYKTERELTFLGHIWWITLMILGCVSVIMPGIIMVVGAWSLIPLMDAGVIKSGANAVGWDLLLACGVLGLLVWGSTKIFLPLSEWFDRKMRSAMY